MKRRSLVLGSVAAGAAAAGLGWRTYQERQSPAAGAEPPLPVWSMSFQRPGGGELSMASLRGKPLLLNFWATWCAPCVREMPQLDRFHAAYADKGWRVVGLAVDGPTPVREFLARQPVRFDIGLAGLEGTDLSRDLGNAQGALPFTAVFDAAGRIVQRKLGESSYDELVRWAAAVAG